MSASSDRLYIAPRLQIASDSAIYFAKNRTILAMPPKDKSPSTIRDLRAEGKRLRAVRYALGYGRHGGIVKFANAYDIPDNKRWGEFENGKKAIQIEHVEQLICVAMPDLTHDWIYSGRTGGLSLRRLKDLETAAADAEADELK